MEIILYKSFSKDLEEEWQKVYSPNIHNLFQCFDWLNYWHQVIGNREKIELNIILVKNDEDNKVIFPLCIKSVKGIKILSFVGGQQTDYNNPIFSEKWNFAIDSNLIWREILKKLPKYDFFHIEKIRNCKNTINFFNKNYFKFKVADSNLLVELPKNWDEYNISISKKFISDTQRRMRKLNKLGEVKFKVFDSEYDSTSDILQFIIFHKSERYKSTGSIDYFSKRTIRDFYQNLPKSFCKNIKKHISALYLDENIIAAHIGFFDKSSFYHIMPTYQMRMSKYAPSRLLLDFLIKWSLEKKLKKFDFTVGSEDYKKDWANKEDTLFEINQPKSIKGYFYLIYLKIKLFLNKNPYFKRQIIKTFNLNN